MADPVSTCYKCDRVPVLPVPLLGDTLQGHDLVTAGTSDAEQGGDQARDVALLDCDVRPAIFAT